MNLWTELGIAPTNDAAAIRRAYAGRLKLVRPDADPERFARLRQAYETALGRAAAAGGGPVAATPAPGIAAPPPATTQLRAEAPAAPLPARPVAAPKAAATPLPEPTDKDLILERLATAQIAAAVDLLLDARRRVALTMADDMAISDRLGTVLAYEPALTAATVRDAARRLGWSATPVGSGSRWTEALERRIAAEDWLEALRRDATRRSRFAGYSPAVCAALLLGQGRARGPKAVWLGMLGRDPTLRKRYGEFLLHRAVVGDRFDPARIEQVGRVLTDRAAPRTRAVVTRFYTGIGLLVPGVLVMGLLDGRAVDRPPIVGGVEVVTVAVFWWVRSRRRRR